MLFGNYQSRPQRNMFFQQPVGQYGRKNIPGKGLGLLRYGSMIKSQGYFPATSKLGKIINGFRGGAGTGMPLAGQVSPGANPAWGTGLQSGGGQTGGSQGFLVPGYPRQGFNQQLRLPGQVNQSPGYSAQEGQRPVQPAWEGPKKGGLSNLISNFMAKRKR